MYESGSLRKSQGWNIKVTNNPKMMQDRRNQALVLSADGMPLFKDLHARSGWPLVIRSANLPDGMWSNLNFAFIHGYQPSEFFTTVDGRTKQVKKDPTSLNPGLSVLTDDYLTGQDVGWTIHDGVSGDDFNMRVVLLYALGDYKATGKLTSFTHAGTFACHWCKYLTRRDMSITRTVYNEHRRWLPAGSPSRRGDTRAPPAPRTHAETSLFGRCGGGVGIDSWCPLELLDYFDLVLDIGPDMMHIAKNIFGNNLVPLMKGHRRPKPPVRLAINKNLDDDEKRSRSAENKRRLASYFQVCQVV